MVLENVKEMWTEKPKGGKGRGVNKDRFVSKMYAIAGFVEFLGLLETELFSNIFFFLTGSFAAILSFSSFSAERRGFFFYLGHHHVCA